MKWVTSPLIEITTSVAIAPSGRAEVTPDLLSLLGVDQATHDNGSKGGYKDGGRNPNHPPSRFAHQILPEFTADFSSKHP